MMRARAISAVCIAVICGAVVGACGGGGDDRGRNGADGTPLAAECGVALPAFRQTVYVSTLGSDADGCGAGSTTACASIDKAIAACTDGGCGVLVRHGLYRTTATLKLRDGASVYGGCRFGGEADRHYRTTIQAAPPPGMPALSANAIHTPTLLHGIVVIAPDETAAGTASLALTVSASTALSIIATTLSSGRGGDGQDGSVPAPAGSPSAGADWDKGGAGGARCTADTEAGTGAGGHGGTDFTTAKQLSSYGFECSSADLGSAGEPAGGAPASARAALGTKGPAGLWCNNRPHDYPIPGVAGGPGAAGACGAATQPSPRTAGSFSGTTWVASRGDDGRPGGVGGGGGGGGAGGACVFETDNIYQGFPGGGGGSGGCGGGVATAGEQGGASMPLVLVDSVLALDAGLNALVPGPGGRGGRAIDAVRGGPGGKAGRGRYDGQSVHSGHYCPALSADGGAGGAGGFGSAAAAGHGGPSIGVALVGKSSAPVGLGAVYLAQPGMPGSAGRGGSIFPGGSCSPNAGPDGAGGVAGLGAALYDFAAPPANFLAAGQLLQSGDSLTSLNGKYRLRLQNDNYLCLDYEGQSVWCFHESPSPIGDQLRMQTDGNLCLYYRGAYPSCTGTQAHPGAYLVAQDDGHVVVTDGAEIFWSRP